MRKPSQSQSLEAHLLWPNSSRNLNCKANKASIFYQISFVTESLLNTHTHTHTKTLALSTCNSLGDSSQCKKNSYRSNCFQSLGARKCLPRTMALRKQTTLNFFPTDPSSNIPQPSTGVQNKSRNQNTSRQLSNDNANGKCTETNNARSPFPTCFTQIIIH